MTREGFSVEERVIDKDGLTTEERVVVDSVARGMGYRGLDHLLEFNGYSSAIEVAREGFFKNVRDYFLGEGWSSRLEEFHKNIQNGNGKH